MRNVLGKMLPPPVSPMALRYVAVLTLPVALLFVAAKVAKSLALHGSFDVAVIAWAAAREPCTFAVWALLWAWTLDHGRRCNHGRTWLHLPLAAVLHALTVVLLALAVLEHGFWLVTGAVMDWRLATFAAQDLRLVGHIVASEMTPGLAAAFAACAAAGVATWWLPLARRWRLGVGDRPRWRQVSAWGPVLAVAVLALLPVAVQGVRVPGRVLSLRSVVPVTLAQTLLRPGGESAGLPAETTPTTPVPPLVVRKTDATKALNVVVVVLESVRARSTTVHTPALATTPFLQRMARDGAFAAHAYTTAPRTTKSLTGVFCGVHPKFSLPVAEADAGSMPTDCMPKVLQRLGWQTGFFSPALLQFERNDEVLREMGFETLAGKEVIPKGPYHAANYFGWEDKAALPSLFAWIDRVRARGPFLAGMLTVTSHHPYQPPPTWPRKAFTAWSRLDDYLNAIAYTDSMLAELWAGLERRGLAKDTLLVVIGDHGEAFNEHGTTVRDDLLYEEALHVPLLLLGPGVPKGRRIDGLRASLDIAPTVYELAGLEVVAGELDGRSLLRSPGHDKLYYSCWQPEKCLGLRVGSQKVIWRQDHDEPLVFDLARDPSETNDLRAAGAVSQAQAQAWVGEMKALRDRVNNRYLAQARRRESPFVTLSKPVLDHEVAVQFGEFAQLVGWHVDRTTMKDGDAVTVDLTFHVTGKPKPKLELLLHAQHPDHLVRGDHPAVGGDHKIADWQPGEYVTDRYWLRIGPGAPAGNYDILTGFYEQGVGTAGRLDAAGTGLRVDTENRALVTTVTLLNPDKPQKPPRDPYLDLPADATPLVRRQGLPKNALDLRIGTGLRLVAVDAPQEATPGSTVTVTYHACKVGPLPRFVDWFVHYSAADGRHLNTAHTPARGHYPIDKWQVGDCVADPHEVTLPKDWPAGPTDVWLGVWGKGLSEPLQRLAIQGTGLPVDAAERRVKVARFGVRARREVPAESSQRAP